ncbi:hydrogenase nickel incorporation protein HypB [bacterium]|nr:hydrogenase nickel incorporation protein HypB [bacterium]
MKKIKIMKNVLQANDEIAQNAREYFSKNGVFVINVMSSPGSGKTTIIKRTVVELKKLNIRPALIEGDIETQLDAAQFTKFNIPIVSINTGPFGGDCHLEAGWVKQASDDMDLDKIDILFIENIGNLVCPAEFDTGAHINVVILSTPEGEDKPLKYPLMFTSSQVNIINKCDLTEILEIDLETMKKNALKINPKIKIIEMSAKTGDGFDKWINYLKKKLKK